MAAEEIKKREITQWKGTDFIKEQQCLGEFSLLDLQPDSSSLPFYRQELDRYINNVGPSLLQSITPSCRKYWPSYFESQFRIRFEEVKADGFLRTGDPKKLYAALPESLRKKEIVLYIESDACPPCDQIHIELFSTISGNQLTHPQERGERVAIKINEKYFSSAARAKLVLSSFPIFILYSPRESNTIRQARVLGYESLEKFENDWSDAEEKVYAEKDPIKNLEDQIAVEKKRHRSDKQKLYNLQVSLASSYLQEGRTDKGISLLRKIINTRKAQVTKKDCQDYECVAQHVWTAAAFEATRALFTFYRMAIPNYYTYSEFIDLVTKLEVDFQWFSPMYLNHADAFYRKGEEGKVSAVNYLVERWKPDYQNPPGKPLFLWSEDAAKIKKFFQGDSRFVEKDIPFIEALLKYQNLIRPTIADLLLQIKKEMEKSKPTRTANVPNKL